MKKELLVPAGDFASLEYAIANGCDAVYLGVQKFSARAYAKNFSKEEIEKAVRLCHLYGVKLYVTMNTLVKDLEVAEFLETISFLYQLGVDAFIMQDFGMISLVLEHFPDIEIHASTQANVCTKEAVLLYHQLGVTRIVLPREMSLEEIEQIDVPIEKEVFIHGALCMSYSGCCLMSSRIGHRSANRGECTGCCRLFYQLYQKNNLLKEGYLLSTKELNTSSKIQDLLNSSITSFKIEGRMKSPFYVGFITRFYRKLLDCEPFSYEEALNELKILFNREFTLGHLFHDDIRNSISPNHLGLEIGKVVEVTPKKIKIKLSYPLYQEDGVRFQKSQLGFVANFIYDASFKLISHAYAGDIVYLDNKVGLTKKDLVYKTTSKNISDSILSLNEKKIPVSLSLEARIDQPLTLTISAWGFTVKEESFPVSEAKKAPILAETLKRQLGKLGNTPFVAQDIFIAADQNIFVAISVLNELRRKVVFKLQEKLENTKRRNCFFDLEQCFFEKLNCTVDAGVTVSLFQEAQLREISKINAHTIYIPHEFSSTCSSFLPIADFSKHLPDRSCLRKFYQRPSGKDVSDYTFNVTNIYTVYYLLKLGYKRVTLSVELSNEEITFLFTHFQEVFHFTPNLEVIVYGRVAVMNIYGNIFDIKECSQYFLQDMKKRRFPVVYKNGFTTVYDCKTISLDLERLSLLPISKRYMFFEEEATVMQQIVNH